MPCHVLPSTIRRLEVSILSCAFATLPAAFGAAARNADFTPLGYLPGSLYPASNATAVSADGCVVVGASSAPSAELEAFRWSEAGAMVGLGELPGGTDGSSAFGVSADGAVIVGSSSSVPGNEIVRWTTEDEVA